LTPTDKVANRGESRSGLGESGLGSGQKKID